jgi:hypothetical protein
VIPIWWKEHPIGGLGINKTFHEVRKMSNPRFQEWTEDVRQFLGRWSDHDIPSHNGTPLEEVELELRKLSLHSTENMFCRDEKTFSKDVIVPDGRYGSFLRCMFPNMELAGDGNYNSISMKDLLTDARLTERWSHQLERNVKRDSLYVFSSVVKKGQPLALGAEHGRGWISLFRQRDDDGLAFWAEAVASPPGPIELAISPAELDRLRRSGAIAANQIVNVIGSRAKSYRLRTYYRSDRIFPTYFKIMRKSLVMAGSNFSPLVAKCLYLAYTSHLRDQLREIIIYDPCAGYGGRCLGALSAFGDQPARYLGTDPNSTNWIEPNRSRYDELADFYRVAVGQKYLASVEVFQRGSEEIHQFPEFNRYRNKIDLIFTSPPYFCAEIYCNEATQSAIKFKTYPDWRDGFLRRTLKTCADYLRPGGYVLWNIADISIKGKYVPLEQDSIDALTEFGLTYERKLKMLLSVGPGNRTDKGELLTKNSVIFNGKDRKYEPIFVFRKPQVH